MTQDEPMIPLSVCDWGKCEDKATYRFYTKQDNTNCYNELCDLHTSISENGFAHDGLYYRSEKIVRKM